MEIETIPIAPPAPVAPATDCVLAFFSTEGIGRALSLSAFTVERQVEILADIAQDACLNAEARMGAIRMLRDQMREALVLEGRIQNFRGRVTKNLPDSAGIGQVEVTRVGFAETDAQAMLAEASRQLVSAREEEQLDAEEPIEEGVLVDRLEDPERDLGGCGLCGG